jgi:hypothetical protein
MNMQNNYFTKELQKTINEMPDNQMNALLLELEGTIYWTAILRYFQQRMMVAQNGLITIDPITKATEMCRTQGTMLGLSDLQSTVILLKE